MVENWSVFLFQIIKKVTHPNQTWSFSLRWSDLFRWDLYILCCLNQLSRVIAKCKHCIVWTSSHQPTNILIQIFTIGRFLCIFRLIKPGNMNHLLHDMTCNWHFYAPEKTTDSVYTKKILRAQSLTSLMANLPQDINKVSSFNRCLNGTFPCSNCSIKTLVH